MFIRTGALLSAVLVLSAGPVLATGIGPGGFNGDGAIDAADVNILFGAIAAGSADPQFDLTGDSTVDHADADYLIRNVLGTEYGDATLDRKIDAADLSLLASNWLSGTAGWGEGNFTADDVVDAADLSLLARNWLWEGGPVGGALAPEPITAATLILSSLAVAGVARKRLKK